MVKTPDVDTDMIFHNSHLHITERDKMGPLTFGNLEGWKDFPKKVKSGDILITGHNFGCGSSRQQAVDCFAALGVSAIAGESFGAIYLRNVINSGIPILTADNILQSGIESGDEVILDLDKSTLQCPAKGIVIQCKPFSQVQMDIYQAGDLFAYGKKMKTA